MCDHNVLGHDKIVKIVVHLHTSYSSIFSMRFSSLSVLCSDRVFFCITSKFTTVRACTLDLLFSSFVLSLSSSRYVLLLDLSWLLFFSSCCVIPISSGSFFSLLLIYIIFMTMRWRTEHDSFSYDTYSDKSFPTIQISSFFSECRIIILNAIVHMKHLFFSFWDLNHRHVLES